MVKNQEIHTKLESDTLHSIVKANNQIKKIDTLHYMGVGDSDTALALFLYKDCFPYDYDLQREEYMRLDSEKVIMPLFESIFKMKSDYKTRLHQVEKNSKRFLIDARKEILSSYKNYSSVTDEMVFEYLLRRKDSVLKSILIQMLDNKNVIEKEKSEVHKILEAWH